MTRFVSAIALASLLAACGNNQPEIAVTADSETLQTLPPETMPEIIADDPDTELNSVDAQYDESWTVGYGWPGEYPNGFTVKASGLVLPGRSVPDRQTAKDMDCPVDYGATYHQWNDERAEIDDLVFVTATRNVPLTVTKAANVEVESGNLTEPLKSISVSPGDTILLERYFGEGFGQIGINGQSYTADIQQLIEYTNGNENDPLTEDEWVRITCADKGAHRAWILMEEVVKLNGIEQYSPTGYGDAADLE